MNPVNWFEIPANDIGQAKSFYEAVFDIEMSLHEVEDSQMAWFPADPGKAGATGALVQAEGCIPSMEGTTVYLSV